MNNKFGMRIGDNGSYYIFEVISSFSIQEQSTVSDYQLVNKTMIADHKFNKPRTITLTGTLSNYSNKTGYPVFNTKTNTFRYLPNLKTTYLQANYSVLSIIKNRDIFVDIYTPNLTIRNCILTSFTWNEENHSATYSLTFNEVRTFTLSETETKLIAPDTNLPNLTDIVEQSLINSTLYKSRVEFFNLVIEELNESNFGSKSVLQGVWSGFLTLISFGMRTSTLSSEKANARRLDQYFQTDWDHNNTNSKDLVLINNIWTNIRKLDQHFKVYSFLQNINQETLLNIGDKFFLLTFKLNERNEYSYTIKDTDNNILVQKNYISPENSIFKLTEINWRFKHGDFKLYFLYDPEHLKDTSYVERSNGKISYEIDLTRVRIVVTKFNLDQFRTTVLDIIKEVLRGKN